MLLTLAQWLVATLPTFQRMKRSTSRGAVYVCCPWPIGTERDSVPFACVLSTDGEVIDYLKLPSLVRSAAARNYQESRVLRDAELLRLRRLIVHRKPHVVALGCESREALNLQKDIEKLIFDLHKENEDFPLLQVELVDTELSLVHAKSVHARQEFPEYPLILKQAVSLGRRLQDPLQEFAAAVNAEDDILCLQLHPLQDSLPKEQLLTGNRKLQVSFLPFFSDEAAVLYLGRHLLMWRFIDMLKVIVSQRYSASLKIICVI